MEGVKSNLWVSPVLVGGAAMEALLLNLTSWGALVLPGLCTLALVIIQPATLVLGVLVLRPTLEIWRDVGLAVPGSAQELNVNAVVGLLVMASLLFNLFRTTVDPRRTAIASVERDRIFDYWILFLAYILFVSLVFSPNINTSLLEFMRLVTVPAVYWLAKKFIPTHPRRAVTTLQMMLLSCLVPVGYGLWQYANGQGQEEFGLLRIFSFMANPVAFSQYLSQVVVVGVLLLLHRQTGGKRLLSALILAAALAAQGLSYGKGGWVGSAVGLMMVGMMYQGQRAKVRNLLVAGLAVLVLGTFLAQTLPGVTDYVARLWQGTTPEESSLATRLAIWKVVWPAFRENPLFGHGLGSGTLIVGQIWGTAYRMHNDYLRLLVDCGIVGLAMYVLIQIYFFRLMMHARQRLMDIDPGFKILVTAALALQSGYLVMIMVDNLVTSMLINYPIWILAGALRGFYEQALRDQSLQPDAPAPAAALVPLRPS